jgi:hypothetical protein
MPEPVHNLYNLIQNIYEYQKICSEISKSARPTAVQDWYFVPAMDLGRGMIAACKFIGFSGMTWNKYDAEHKDFNGGTAKRNLEKRCWFRELNGSNDEDDLLTAKRLARLIIGYRKHIFPQSVKFYILKDKYNDIIKDILQ